MTIHNTTAAVTMTRTECSAAVAAIVWALAKSRPSPEDAAALESASEALLGLLDGFTHLVLRENDDE